MQTFFEQLKDHGESASLGFIFLAIILYLINVTLTSLRWRRSLTTFEVQISLFESLRSVTAGLVANSIISFSGVAGALVRMKFVAKVKKIEILQISPAFVFDRLGELLSFLMIMVISAGATSDLIQSTLQQSKQDRSLLIIIILTLFIFGIAIIIQKKKLYAVVIRAKLMFSRLKRPSNASLLYVAGISIVIGLLDIFRIKLITTAFGATLGFEQNALLVLVAGVGSLSPFLGGLFIVESGLMLTLYYFGVSPSQGVLMVGTERLITIAMMPALAGLSIIVRKIF